MEDQLSKERHHLQTVDLALPPLQYRTLGITAAAVST